MTRPRTNYLRAVSLGTLFGLCATNIVTSPSDLLRLMQVGEQAAVVFAWIGGLL